MTDSNKVDLTPLFTGDYRPLPPRERLRCSFSDTLCEADEYITAGEVTIEDVVDDLADSFIELQKYFQDKVKVYESLFTAISERASQR